MASMAMTEQTPKMMPNIVRIERSLCSIKLLMPSRTVLMNWKLSILGKRQFRRSRQRSIDHFTINRAVFHVNNPMGAGRDAFVVCHQHDGFSRVVQPANQFQNFGAGLGIKVA